MKLRILLITFITLVFSGVSNAQLLQWNTIGNVGTETTEPSTSNDPNIAAANLTLGGVIPAANGNRFGGNNWFDTGDTNPTTLAESIADNDYIQFTVTPNAGFSFTATSLVFGWERSGTGPDDVTLRSSADGYASDLGSVIGMSTSITLGNTITISGLSNITAATTFRLYGYGATATGGTGGFDQSSGPGVVNVQLNGTTISTSIVDWANLQFPNTTTSVNVGTPVTYYARVYEAGVTNAVGQGPGITSWIGYSTTNSNPNTAGWTWVAATYNVDAGNDDEYQASLNLPVGIYYVASRFQLGAGTYSYGGSDGASGGFWNGTTNVSQVLIVNDSNTVDWCNLQSPVSGSLVLGGVFNIYGQVYEPSLTPGAGFQGAGIVAWLGYSTANSNPNSGGWTWVPMNFNAFGGGDDNDEYMQDIGSFLTLPGTYYYATRFELNSSGVYRYGGILSSGINGGFWDGVNYISGVLTVTSPPSQEINLQGLTGGTNNIVNGSGTASGLNNTLFASTTVGGSTTKDYRIENTGTAALNLTGVPKVSIGGVNPGDFAVTTQPPVGSVAAGLDTSFIITFSPTATGTRTAVVSIASNDVDENPYTFLIQGNGNCSATANTITPTSGPAGTEITVTASSNNLTGATATFNGVAVAVTPVDATHIKIIIPVGAISGNLITTNASGCTATNYISVTRNVIGSCGGGSDSSELFISEVTDATIGGLSYVEIYNGSGNPINLGNYALQIFSNGGASYSSSLNLNNVILNSGSMYLVALGAASSPSSSNTCIAVTGGNGELANQVSTAPGINFDTTGNDHIALVNIATNTKVDSFGTYLSATWANSLSLGDRGAVFRRLNTAVLPSVTYSNADWIVTNWVGMGSGSCGTNDYSNIGTYIFTVATPPAVTQHPVYSPACKATSFTVAGLEGVGGAPGLAYQWFVAAPGSANWIALTDVGVYTGSTAPTLNISNISGLDGYQYYCQIRENSSTCYAASNAVKITESTVVWDGASWTPPSGPNITSNVAINGPYNTAMNGGSFDACSLTVNSTLFIDGDDYVNIQNDLTVSAGATLTIADDGSLVMIDDLGVVTNSGTTTVARTTTPYNKFDYTYWSSPVTNAVIATTFPTWRLDYAFQFATANYADVIAPLNGFDDDGNAWLNVSGPMTPGKGYAIMAPTTGTFPATNTVTFSGQVNNGVINMPVALSADPVSNIDDFNLIGNPYPSALYADQFIDLNAIQNSRISGTLYFWTHRTQIAGSTPGPNAFNFITEDYAMYNLSGAVGTGTGTGSLTGSAAPTGKIASGQGFFVDAASASNVVFNNAMRDETYLNNDFFRVDNEETERDRIWLNLESAQGLFSQQLVGYFPNTTLDVDVAYDGIVSKTSNTISFYSFIGDQNYRIQARPGFDINDQVPLGYSTGVANTYTISIDHKEGQLDSEDTNIYVEDKTLNIIHDLKQGPYSFTTEAGTFDDRFLLRYTNGALGTPEVDFENNVIVVSNEGLISVKSYLENLDNIAIYDIAGRIVFSKNNISDNQFEISDVVRNNQALIIKITLENGVAITKKLVF